jgi:hypothetical protein
MKVRAIYEWEIDPEAYVAAAINEEWAQPGELDPANLEAIAEHATGYTDPEDNMYRWVRSAMRVVSSEIKIADDIDNGAGCICGGKW